MLDQLKMIESKRWKVIAALVLLSALLFSWSDIYTFARYRDDGQREAHRIILRIQNTVDIPETEPSLATVEDVSKINRGGVLADAANGDKILLFYTSGRAVLYRPSTGKVISTGPIVLDASTSQVKDTRIIVRNGSGDNTKLSNTMALLKNRYPTADIAEPEVASRTNYPTSIVIDLTVDGKKSQFVNAIIELTGAQKGILPQGEDKPDADILVIVGRD